jgi:signal transduction histidine kinase
MKRREALKALSIAPLAGLLPFSLPEKAKENKVKNRLAEMQTLIASILKETRHLIANLRPALLDDLGLIPGP